MADADRSGADPSGPDERPPDPGREERLFRAYMHEGRSVADHDELVALAADGLLTALIVVIGIAGGEDQLRRQPVPGQCRGGLARQGRAGRAPEYV